ncbi:bifunctional DNA primase/polymerase [Nocardia sp. CA-107356]|uniref:bifunctional DNA primase/polymerase n=1 Tax=Nocardia sp. CA-107356 TaxID=3239972 RepID=UPI003D917855
MVASRRSRHSARLMQAALTAAEHGHHVFPLRTLAKTPAYKEHWLHHATADPDEVRRIWRERPYNVGIACAPSGLYVIDLDPSHGEQAPAPWAGLAHGREVLVAIAQDAGHPFPGSTYTVATPSSGLHLYFRAPTTIRLPNTSGTVGWRIDTRGDGGYIVAAGSVLPHGNYTVIDPRPPQPLPAWLITKLTPPPLPTRRPSRPVDIDRANRYVQVALHAQADRVRAAPRGQRHTILLLAANSLGRIVGADILDENRQPLALGILDYSTAYAVLYDAASTHIGIDDFTDTEAARTITDGLNHGSAHSRQITLRTP